MVYYCSIKDDCNLTQCETIEISLLRLETWPQWCLNAFIEDSQTTGYKKEEKAKWRERSQKAFPCFCRERELSLPVYHHPDQKKKMNFLSRERKSVFDKILIFIPTSYFSEKDYDVSVCGRLWCHSSMVVLELPSVLDTKQLVLHC